jgi:hypothetical protein
MEATLAGQDHPPGTDLYVPTDGSHNGGLRIHQNGAQPAVQQAGVVKKLSMRRYDNDLHIEVDYKEGKDILVLSGSYIVQMTNMKLEGT